MPQPGPPAAPSQRVTLAALVESQGEAEELGTASSTSERIKQSDRPQRPETSENGQKHQNNSPSTTAQKSQDATAEHGPDNQAKSSNKAPKLETRLAVVEASPSLFIDVRGETRNMAQPQLLSTLTANNIDQYYHTSIEAIRFGTRNLESYYAMNDEQIAENKLLKEANQGLQSLIRQAFTENATLKKEAAENKEELDKLLKEKKR
ncbi:hypothetical protein BJX68DRAFT_261783 [Aspergillus pseudodeflectus]|uniref:Uncharacterized protein n=1 Tax=Aspergillus pseudodeflectus TaxID=176178 RepID=A0ABR4L492_9EURO